MYGNYRAWGSAEGMWGELFILVQRILGKLPPSFSANFDGDFLLLSTMFFQDFRPPKISLPKFTPRNGRHSSPISLSRTQFFFTPMICLLGWSRINCVITIVAGIGQFQELFNSTLANHTKQFLMNYFPVVHTNVSFNKKSWHLIVQSIPL